MTTIRLFAALRAAADGDGEVEVAAATPAAVAHELAERYGETMRLRLRVARVFVDGTPLPIDDDTTRLDTATEVVLVPPFAGGA